MLNELESLQSSDETIRSVSVSIDIETQEARTLASDSTIEKDSEDNNAERTSSDSDVRGESSSLCSSLIHKTYTFSYAQAFDKWTFNEYKEKATEDTPSVSDRSWETVKHIYWHEHNEVPTIDIPPEVTHKLGNITNSNTITVEIPAGTAIEHKYNTYDIPTEN